MKALDSTMTFTAPIYGELEVSITALSRDVGQSEALDAYSIQFNGSHVGTLFNIEFQYDHQLTFYCFPDCSFWVMAAIREMFEIPQETNWHPAPESTKWAVGDYGLNSPAYFLIQDRNY